MLKALCRTAMYAMIAIAVAHPALAQKDGGLKDPPISSEKLNDYTKGFNFLVGTFGLTEQYQQYTGQQIARKSVNDSVFVSAGWIDQALDNLHEARAISDGGLPELDQAGDRIIPVLDRLVGRLKALNEYYESRGQLEDKFARGKREDPLVLADFKEALADMAQLNVALDAATDRRESGELEALKASGDIIGYDGGLALQKSKALVDLFNLAQDIRDPAKVARGDALVDSIQAALSDERKQLAEAKASGDIRHSMRNTFYGTAADRLTGLIGAYRDFKRGGNASQHQAMVSAYNDAVEQVNTGH